jgi:hypothetical protein
MKYCCAQGKVPVLLVRPTSWLFTSYCIMCSLVGTRQAFRRESLGKTLNYSFAQLLVHSWNLCTWEPSCAVAWRRVRPSLLVCSDVTMHENCQFSIICNFQYIQRCSEGWAETDRSASDASEGSTSWHRVDIAATATP